MAWIPRRSTRAFAGAGAALVLGGAALWGVSSATARSGVEVLVGATPFECVEPGAVTTNDLQLGSDDGVTLTLPALNVTRNMDCRFTFIVHNTSNVDVKVKSLDIQLAGPGNGTGVRIGTLEFNDNTFRALDNQEADARFEINDSLPAGEAARVTAMVGSMPGCLGAGGSQSMVNSPSLRISALGFGGDVSPRGPVYSLMGTAESSCES
ncbi:hypothetical protein ACIPVK_11580 [Paeniglutamicibacter sp. MACA_103]|uniref:hypothetical protein n=1 Tax=Paeniglutamicibacter sp. MACA_103 TaxID=3377337 RepID=UPI003894C57A